MTDVGLKELAPLAKLASLDLYHTQVTDEGFEDLAALKGLTDLCLIGTMTTQEGVAELRKALPKYTISS